MNYDSLYLDLDIVDDTLIVKSYKKVSTEGLDLETTKFRPEVDIIKNIDGITYLLIYLNNDVELDIENLIFLNNVVSNVYDVISGGLDVDEPKWIVKLLQ